MPRFGGEAAESLTFKCEVQWPPSLGLFSSFQRRERRRCAYGPEGFSARPWFCAWRWKAFARCGCCRLCRGRLSGFEF